MHPIFTTCREKSLEISTCHLTTHTACGLDASYWGKPLFLQVPAPYHMCNETVSVWVNEISRSRLSAAASEQWAPHAWGSGGCFQVSCSSGLPAVQRLVPLHYLASRRPSLLSVSTLTFSCSFTCGSNTSLEREAFFYVALRSIWKELNSLDSLSHSLTLTHLLVHK